jgi:HAD superfamily hydrolase (TIGR01509 family)
VSPTTGGIRAILFDLDGVLFDTEPLHRRAWIETMRRFGHEIDEQSLMRWTGIPCIDLAEHYEKTLSPYRPRDEYHDEKGRSFREIARRDLVAYPLVVEAIRELRTVLSLGYVTSNYRLDAALMLEVAGYSPLLPVGVAYEDVTKHKPDPEPYLTAARLIGIEPERCAVVEDSPSGVASARSAGMTVAAVTTTFTVAELSAAHRVFPDTKRAIEWVRALG